MWICIKGALTAPNGEPYFASERKGQCADFGWNSHRSEARVPAHKVVVSLSRSTERVAEAVLKLSRPLTGKVEPNSGLRFEGVATAFTREPFLLTMDVEPTGVTGLKTTPCKR